MPKISSTIVGAAGEIHVLSQLLRRGWIAALAPDGAPNMDILVTDENNQKLCAIQVKTRRDIGSDRGWHMRRKHEDLVAEDLFYVFVNVGKQPTDPTLCHILSSSVVAACVRDTHQVWLETPGRGGLPHNDGPLRRLLPDYSHMPAFGCRACQPVRSRPTPAKRCDTPEKRRRSTSPLTIVPVRLGSLVVTPLPLGTHSRTQHTGFALWNTPCSSRL